MTFCKKKTHNM